MKKGIGAHVMAMFSPADLPFGNSKVEKQIMERAVALWRMRRQRRVKTAASRRSYNEPAPDNPHG
jgi:hypothetical protein